MRVQGIKKPGLLESGHGGAKTLRKPAVFGCQASSGRRPVISLWGIPLRARFQVNSAPGADLREGAHMLSWSLSEGYHRFSDSHSARKWCSLGSHTRGSGCFLSRFLAALLPLENWRGPEWDCPSGSLYPKAKFKPLATVCLALTFSCNNTKHWRLNVAGWTQAQAVVVNPVAAQARDTERKGGAQGHLLQVPPQSGLYFSSELQAAALKAASRNKKPGRQTRAPCPGPCLSATHETVPDSLLPEQWHPRPRPGSACLGKSWLELATTGRVC